MRDIHPATGPRETEHPARGRRNGRSCPPLAISEEDVACGRVVPMKETFSSARKMPEELKATGEIRCVTL